MEFRNIFILFLYAHDFKKSNYLSVVMVTVWDTLPWEPPYIHTYILVRDKRAHAPFKIWFLNFSSLHFSCAPKKRFIRQISVGRRVASTYLLPGFLKKLLINYGGPRGETANETMNAVIFLFLRRTN